MPWQEVTIMSQRLEFVQLALQPGANISTLCHRYRISRKTGYKWIARYAQDGPAGLVDQSRCPRQRPAQTAPTMEAAVVALRQDHPAWGGRTLARVLQNRKVAAVPAPSTITGILRRHGLLNPTEAAAHTPYQRFERERPNELWQMDFKGHFALTGRGRCHPLTVLDDHSRFAVVLAACADEQTATVQAALIPAFERYGLPEAILTDNGPPWGDGPDSPYTSLGVWLMRLGIRVLHGRVYHPQTQGKDERFNRTLKAEVLLRASFADLAACQAAFDAWRPVYNLVRPHQGLALQTPSQRYQISPRPYPGAAPPIEYGPEDAVRQVQQNGRFSFRGRAGRVAKAFVHQPIAIRRLDADDEMFAVYFCRQCLLEFHLTDLPKEA